MRLIGTVAWSVRLSVCLSVTIVSPAKNGSTDRDAVWVVDSGGPKELCIRWGPRKGQFWGERATHCKVQWRSAVSYAKPAESIKFLFGLHTRVGPRKHCEMGVTLAPPGEYNWTAYVRRRCGLFVKLLWSLVCLCHDFNVFNVFFILPPFLFANT